MPINKYFLAFQQLWMIFDKMEKTLDKVVDLEFSIESISEKNIQLNLQILS